MLSRAMLVRVVETRLFQNTIIGLIVLNAMILGLQTSAGIMAHIGDTLTYMDHAILAIFVVEILMRMCAYGPRFFTSAWNWFDFIIVGVALMPASEAFSALRTLRILRVLRLISAIPEMRKVVEGILHAVPGIASVSAIMLLIFYVFAVMGNQLYGDMFPEWFGTLGDTMFTLFQVMTLEGWAMEIVRPIMAVFPNAWLYFLIYILVSTFTVLNLFIAIIVNAMEQGHADEAADARDAIRQDIMDEIRASEARIMAAINAKKER
jgi:voltage-gated sodium channel